MLLKASFLNKKLYKLFSLLKLIFLIDALRGYMMKSANIDDVEEKKATFFPWVYRTN